MAVILHTTRSIARSGVQAFSLRQLVAAAVSCGILLVVSAFGAGLMVGRYFSMPGVVVPMAKADPAKEKFAFDQLGSMTGRLVRLEGDARSLVKKLSALEALETRLADLKSGKAVLPGAVATTAASTGAGGRVFAPQGCAVEGLDGVPGRVKADQTEKSLACLQDLLNRVETAAAKRSVAYMSLPIKQPVNATRLGSAFGNRVDPINGRLAFHSGLDFEAPVGTPIRAAGGGKVKTANWVSDLGFVVEIEHGNGLMTRYAHTSKMYVKAGDIVTPGQLIAAVGSTGRSTGPHLHFEILHEGRFVDPTYYLNIGAQVPNV